MFDRYKIKKDDTLDLIAKKFNTDTNYLKSINDIYFLDNIREGMDMIVPSNNDIYYDVINIKKGDKLENIAKENNINLSLLAAMNGLDTYNYVYKDEKLLIPKMNYSYYITKKGDTIDEVSKIFGISKDRMLSQNKTIYLLDGQILVNKKIK